MAAFANCVFGLRFRAEKLIYQGPITEVYKGHTTDDELPIVVKLFLKNTEYLFKTEVDAYNKLRGINAVPRLLWAGYEHGYPALAFPMLSADLWHYGVKLRHLLTSKIIHDVAIRALEGLEAIHERGFIHGDIKPSNFALNMSGKNEVCFLDLGSAERFIDDDGNHREDRRVSQFLGTLLFAGPQALRHRAQSRRCDLMSLVQTVAWLLDGDLPWARGSYKISGEDADENLALARQKAKQLPELFRAPEHTHLRRFARMVFALTFDERPDYDGMRALLREAPVLLPKAVKASDQA